MSLSNDHEKENQDRMQHSRTETIVALKATFMQDRFLAYPL